MSKVISWHRFRIEICIKFKPFYASNYLKDSPNNTENVKENELYISHELETNLEAQIRCPSLHVNDGVPCNNSEL